MIGKDALTEGLMKPTIGHEDKTTVGILTFAVDVLRATVTSGTFTQGARLRLLCQVLICNIVSRSTWEFRKVGGPRSLLRGL